MIADLVATYVSCRTRWSDLVVASLVLGVKTEDAKKHDGSGPFHHLCQVATSFATEERHAHCFSQPLLSEAALRILWAHSDVNWKVQRS